MPEKAAPAEAAGTPPAGPTVVIDNYDSFTWNIVEYICVLDPQLDVRVFRNDKITIAELESLQPARLVISPGPGHPLTDSGVSSAAIRAFAGRIPILGVCMGLQCIISCFGGSIEFAGEIVHGKTSRIRHDGRGVYHNVPQDIAVTRYHSLAGVRATMPAELEVTSWSSDTQVIMGARHRDLVVEGVQYHPESILSEQGKALLKNFLEFTHGTWAAETAKPRRAPAAQPSILERIHAQRIKDIAAASQVPGSRVSDLQRTLDLGACPPPIDMYARMRSSSGTMALMAEIKRASPSKSDIDVSASASAQALEYALSGASVISCLTEAHWFKGSVVDMAAARAAVAALPHRPAILRKDFICDRYQVLEARVNGADSLLLIVAMLTEAELRDLLAYSRSLHMEPLVEVNSMAEMELALAVGARIVGVNNRNLHTFAVDLGTTSSVAAMVPKDVILCALSGISTRQDVVKYAQEGVSAVLVGEALMRAQDTRQFVADLLGIDARPSQALEGPPLVKVCGTRSVEAARAAVEAGADMVGMIFVPGSRRSVTLEQGRDIAQAVRAARELRATAPSTATSSGAPDWFGYQASWIRRRAPLAIGVFRNAALEEIQATVDAVGLDMVQLHGSEPVEWARFITVPVIKVFPHVDSEYTRAGYHAVPLLDAVAASGESGGLGIALDWAATAQAVAGSAGKVRPMLAGGLTPENVASAISTVRPLGVDTSSGVEGADGQQDTTRIRQFVAAAKQAV